jgi:ABC-type polar amino acid transport system ATPase subunit
MSIRVTELDKCYPGSRALALSALSLHVEKGKVASVVGRSGSGKTTLLRCLSGLDPFDRGSIEVDGVTVSAGAAARGPLAFLGRIGLVFQSFELFPHLSVLDNCTLAPVKVRKASRKDAEARALGLLEQFKLADKAHAFPEALSGGQKQRVAIARALAMEPRVLLYDEPTSALDPSLKSEVGQALRRVADTGITQIMVTHDVAVARDVSDTVIVLDGGRVVRQGPPGSVLDALA